MQGYWQVFVLDEICKTAKFMHRKTKNCIYVVAIRIMEHNKIVKDFSSKWPPIVEIHMLYDGNTLETRTSISISIILN